MTGRITPLGFLALATATLALGLAACGSSSSNRTSPQGAKVLFQVAGRCGLGALSAAQQKGVQGIGVDADQSFLGSYILTSAEKRVDNAVFNAIKGLESGRFAAGSNVTYSVANGGISYGRIGPAGLKFAPQIEKIYDEIKSGQISNIPNTVKSSGGGASITTTGSSSSGAKLKVGLVTDIGGLDDHGFNHLAYVGLKRAEAQLGVQGRVLTSSSSEDYLPNLTTLARDGYDLIIPVGFLMAQATDQVAKAFPRAKFAIVDADATAEAGDPKNVEGLLFEEQQAGYLVGYLAGLYARAHGYSVISSVGGQKIPPVERYIAGYQAGAKAADSGIQTLNGYSESFTDRSKCEDVALNQIAHK